MGVTADGKGKPVAIRLPSESLIDVVSQESTEDTIEVMWNNQTVSVFAIDLRQRAIPIEEFKYLKHCDLFCEPVVNSPPRELATHPIQRR